MNKKLLKVSVIGIVIGSLLLYMSVYGAAGFGLSLTGTTFQENFDAYPGPKNWQSYNTGVHGTPVISPAGQLELNAPLGGRTACMSNVFNEAPPQWTAEFRLKIDEFGDGAGATAGRQVIGVYDTTYWVPFAIYAGYITDGIQNATLVTDNAWHVWTLVCTGSSTDVYRDSPTKLMAMAVTQVGVTPKVSLDAFGGTTKRTLAHFDYFYVDEGLHPPSQTPTYTLTVNAVCGGSSLTGPTATVSGSSFSVPHTWTLTSSSASATIQSSYVSGTTTYTFSQWDNGATSNTRSGTLSAGSNTWTATYTSSTPPPGQYSVTVLTKDSSGTEFSGCQVTFNGVVKSSGSATFNVAAGTYSVSVQSPYNGISFAHWEDGSTTNQRSYYVSQTVTLTAYFTGSGPVPWDPLAGLRDLLNNFTVRNYELIAGAVAVLLSSVLMLVAFFVKKKTVPSMPFIG